MMTDKDLLELAAKAAGIRIRWHSDGYYGPTMEIMEDEAGGPPWNPLTDDGDALRLAVKLGLEIYYADNGGGFSYASYEEADRVTRYAVEPHGTDSCAATRRAIVRAASEIGRKE
jgi:hypothetical protein